MLLITPAPFVKSYDRYYLTRSQFNTLVSVLTISVHWIFHRSPEQRAKLAIWFTRLTPNSKGERKMMAEAHSEPN